MNCIKLGKLMLEVDIKHFQVRALADINGLQTLNLHHCQVIQPKTARNIKRPNMTKDRASTRTPCPFAMLKILSQKTNTITSEYLLTQPYEKNYFSACPPAVVGQFIF